MNRKNPGIFGQFEDVRRYEESELPCRSSLGVRCGGVSPNSENKDHYHNLSQITKGRSSIIQLLSNPVGTISTHTQTHCLLILLLNYKLPAGASRRVINLSRVGFAHLLLLLMQKGEGALSQLSGRHNEMEVFYSDILLRSVFQKIIQINLTLRKSIYLNFQILETVALR